MTQNYLEVNKGTILSSLFSKFYVFIDTSDHFYKQVFEGKGITVKAVKEYSKSDSHFRLILCRINKKDEHSFINTIGQIYNKALLLGYTDYEKMCNLLHASAKYTD